MLNPAKPRYRVDLSRQQAGCEANYARLMKLLPALQQLDRDAWTFSVQVGHGRRQIDIVVTERARYTTTLCIEQRGRSHDWEEQPKVEVRLYHDARMAEVLQWHQHRRMQARYDYPNQNMYQCDEKAQINQFLGEWLNHCLTHGWSDRGLEAYPFAG